MLVEYLGTEGNCLFGTNITVSQYLEGKLIVVSNVADTGVFNRVANIVYRCVNRVSIDYTDYRLVVLLVRP